MTVDDFVVSDMGSAVLMTAYCHGDEQIVLIPDTVWDEYDPDNITLGEAFTE